MIYLDAEDLVRIAGRVVDGEVLVRDFGLLEAAAARPRASVFGQDAYPSLHEKAAALLQSFVKNHALIDGNKRLGLAGVIAFLGINGWILTYDNDEAYDLVIAIADGSLTEISEIADRLLAGTVRKGSG